MATALGAAGVLVLVVGVLVLDDDRKGRDDADLVDIGGKAEITVDTEYVAYLTLTDVRELTVQETLELAGGPRRSFTLALKGEGWKMARLPTGRFGYSRSESSKADVVDGPPWLPAQTKNRFPVPQIHELPLPSRRTLTLSLTKESHLLLDAPRNAIGDTFPAATPGRGPGDSTRTTLPLPERAAAWEYGVRSKPFRWPILEKAADVTVWSIISSVLGFLGGLLTKRVEEVVVGWFNWDQS